MQRGNYNDGVVYEMRFIYNNFKITFVFKNDMEISLFDVFQLVAIPKNKITSIATDLTHVYISCKDGKLMIYELNDRIFITYIVYN